MLASIVVLRHAGFEVLPFVSGGLAVKVFFALSGWLIGGILLKTEISGLPRFYFNRATRIWIPYALAIILLYGLAAVKEGVDYFWIKYLVLDITFTHQLFTIFPAAARELPMDGSGNQFWSIAVEEQFYLLAPFFMLFVPKGKTVVPWVGVAIAAALLGAHALPISLGVLAAIAEERTGFADIRAFRLGAMVLAGALALVMAGGNEASLVQAIFSVAVVIACAGEGQRGAVGIAVGGLSFPLYLNHWIGVFAVHAVSKRLVSIPFPVFVVTQYVLNLAVAFVLYWFVDQNIQRYRNSWFTPERGRWLAIVAYGLVGFGLIAGFLMQTYGPRATS